MAEIFELAVSGINIFPTILFGLMILFWLLSLLAGLDIDGLDFDLDLEVDFLSFLNFGNIPLTIYASITTFVMWALQMTFSINTGITGGVVALGVLAGAFTGGIVVTSLLAIPLKGVFKHMGGKSAAESLDLKGQLCTLKYDLEGDGISQGMVDDIEQNILINVKKFKDTPDMKKGQQGLIIKEDPSRKFYFIELYNENEWE